MEGNRKGVNVKTNIKNGHIKKTIVGANSMLRTMSTTELVSQLDMLRAYVIAFLNMADMLVT
jgi:hypothetical protein